jgi:hypothetical protein
MSVVPARDAYTYQASFRKAASGEKRESTVIASKAKQSISPRKEEWIASSLCSSQ